MEREKIAFHIDECRYRDWDERALCLVGWVLDMSGKMPELALFGESGERLSLAEAERLTRPDVAAGYPQMPSEACLGFRLRIPEAESLAGEKGQLRLCALLGGQSTGLWSADAQEIREIRREQMMQLHMDRQEVIYGTLLIIEGWALMQRGSLQIQITDGQGRPVPAKLTRGRRPDVVEGQNLPEVYREQEMGFRAQIKVSEIPGRELILLFEGDTGEEKVQKRCTIDVKQLCRENSPMGRRKKVLAWENRGENLAYLKKKGLREFVRYVDVRAGIVTGDYEQWLARHRAGRRELAAQRRQSFPYRPRLSVVIPLYETPLPFLKEIVDSVRRQSYQNWQLVLADGSKSTEVQNFIRKRYGREKRICYRRLEENGGISENTNRALELAKGEYLLFADHDDVLAPEALYEIVKAINQSARTSGRPAEVLYTDEDKLSMDGRHYFEPNLKPDYNLFRLRENNYICHLFAVQKTFLDEVGFFRKEFDGAQDFDLILRCCERARQVVHIPKVLYHWRCHMESTAADPASKAYAYEAGRRAIEEHYARMGIRASVEMTERLGWYRSRVQVQGNPLVSVIIPNKDHIRDLELCLSSMDEKSTYRNFEVLVAENNSEEPETFAYYEQMVKKYPFVRLLTWEEGFNFSKINNFAAGQAAGEYLLFLNNDVEILSPGWIEEMLGICQQNTVAAVGAKLYYPDATIQHAGVVIGLGGIAGHLYCRAAGDEEGYMGRLVCVQEMSAVTAACMLVKKSFFDKVGGFDPDFAVAFNDIDLCMKLRSAGGRVVFTPYAQLRHYESKSRGLEDTPEKQLRFKKETKLFQEKWEEALAAGDPYYSPNLSLMEGDCRLREI